LLEKSPESVLCFLAILKAGAAYLPLDPDHPEARLDAMLKAAQPTVVLSNGRLQGRLPRSAATLLLVEEAAASTAGASSAWGIAT